MENADSTQKFLIIDKATNADISEQTRVYQCKKILKYPGICRGCIIKKDTQEKIPCKSEYAVYDFEEYIKVVHGDTSELYSKNTVDYEDGSKNILDYFRDSAALLETVFGEEKVRLLKYNLMHMPLFANSAATAYIQGKAINIDNSVDHLIFPAKTNASQMQAVRMALQNNISVITGFAGTGKTQTISNLVANIIMAGKTAAVITYNESSIQNIWDKLRTVQYLSQLCMPVNMSVCGIKNAELHKKFIFTGEQYTNAELQKKIDTLTAELEELYQKKNELQQLKQQRRDMPENIQDVENSIANLEDLLTRRHFQENENLLQQYSQEMLCNHIEHDYEQAECTDADFDTVQGASSLYPVIVTDVDTLIKEYAAGEKKLFDYVIIDNASMLDVLEGVCCLSYASNAVIIGDSKQIGKKRNDHDKQLYKKLQAIGEQYDIDTTYNYLSKNLLSSVLTAVAGLKTTTLREHYRCHPKIISFCNQQFYNNEMIIMTEDYGEEEVIAIKKTVPGNHARNLDNRFNLRQDEESQKLKQELCSKYNYDKDDILCVVPYKKQCEIDKTNTSKLITELAGVEKKVIIFETVYNTISNSDVDSWIFDPLILNTILSRAIERFFIIISGNNTADAEKKNNINYLIEYIDICAGNILGGTINSIFDCIYADTTTNNKDIAEKQMSKLLQTIVQNDQFSFLTVKEQVPLKTLIKDTPAFDTLTDNEKEYALDEKHIASVDFVLYTTDEEIDKPVLCIEVDGYRFHGYQNNVPERDKKKESILNKCSLELIRFNTIESNEENRLEKRLNSIFYDDKNLSSYAIKQYLSYIRKTLVDAAKDGTLCCIPNEDGNVNTVPAANPTNNHMFEGINQLLAKQYAKNNNFESLYFITKSWIKANGYNLLSNAKPFPFLPNPKQRPFKSSYNVLYVHISQIEHGEKIITDKSYGEDLTSYGYEIPSTQKVPIIKNNIQEIICSSSHPEKYLGEYLAAIQCGAKFIATQERAQAFVQEFIDAIHEKNEKRHTDIFKIESISEEAKNICKQILKK